MRVITILILIPALLSSSAFAALPNNAISHPPEKFRFTQRLGFVLIGPDGNVVCGSKGPKTCGAKDQAEAQPFLNSSIRPAKVAFVPGLGIVLVGAATCAAVGAITGASYAIVKGGSAGNSTLELASGSVGLASVGGAGAVTYGLIYASSHIPIQSAVGSAAFSIGTGLAAPVVGIGICVTLISIAGKAGHKLMTLLGPDEATKRCMVTPQSCSLRQ